MGVGTGVDKTNKVYCLSYLPFSLKQRKICKFKNEFTNTLPLSNPLLTNAGKIGWYLTNYSMLLYR